MQVRSWVKAPLLWKTQFVIIPSIVIFETLDLDPDFLHTKSSFLVILPKYGNNNNNIGTLTLLLETSILSQRLEGVDVGDVSIDGIQLVSFRE